MASEWRMKINLRVKKYLNDISFSTQGVPEPTNIALFGITGLALAMKFRRKRP